METILNSTLYSKRDNYLNTDKIILQETKHTNITNKTKRYKYGNEEKSYDYVC
jgi:hypothetical protein